MAYLWTSFLRLRRRKGVGFDGLLPIEWTDIDAFCRRVFPLAPWEIEIIEKLDDFWLTRPETEAEPEATPQDTTPAVPRKKQKIASRPVTSKLFDAIFGVT